MTSPCQILLPLELRGPSAWGSREFKDDGDPPYFSRNIPLVFPSSWKSVIINGFVFSSEIILEIVAVVVFLFVGWFVLLFTFFFFFYFFVFVIVLAA